MDLQPNEVFEAQCRDSLFHLDLVKTGLLLVNLFLMAGIFKIFPSVQVKIIGYII
jgi:hypothetical protein